MEVGCRGDGPHIPVSELESPKHTTNLITGQDFGSWAKDYCRLKWGENNSSGLKYKLKKIPTYLNALFQLILF